MGVSPRRLTGWEPATVTTYIYDDSGQLVQSVTVQEPEFSPEDLARLRGHLLDARAPRGRHGFLLSEAMSPDANPQRDPKYRFVAEGPQTDFAEKARVEAIAKYETENPKADLKSMLWTVKKVEL